MMQQDIERFFVMLLAGRAPSDIIEEFFAGEAQRTIDHHVRWLTQSWERFQEMCEVGELAPLSAYRAFVAKQHHN